MLSDDAKNRVLNEVVFMAFTGNLTPANEDEQPTEKDSLQVLGTKEAPTPEENQFPP